MNRPPKVLFISPVYPADLARAVFGVFQRMRVLIDAAVLAGTELRLLFFIPPGLLASAPSPAALRQSFADQWGVDAEVVLVATGERAANAWNTYLAPMASFAEHADYWPYSGPGQNSALERLAADCDLLIAHRLAAMVPVLRTDVLLPPVVFDLDDIEDVKMSRDLARPSDWRGRRLLYLQLPALRRLQAMAIERAARTLVCSDHDRIHLLRRNAAWRVVTMENSIDTRFEPAAAPRLKRLFFVGTFTYQPNLEAANYLIGEVWPRVLEQLPEARLLIAGNRPERLGAFGKNVPGVEFCGFVADLAALYASVDVVCCPILSGGGTRIKILEAAANARPVVSTTIGAEGLTLTDGREILLADEAEGIARHCIELLAHPDKAAAIGTAARAAVQTRHDRTRIVTRLADLYGTILVEPLAGEGSRRGR